MNRRLITLAVASFAVLGIACGSGGTGTTTSAGDGGAGATDAPKVATVAVGKPLTLTRDLLGDKTGVTITVSQVTPGLKGDEFIKPEHGQYVAFKVDVVVTQGKYTTGFTDFKLVAKDGSVFESTLLSAKKPDLGTKELAKGQKTSGWVTIDAAKGAEKGGRIALKDFLAEADAGYWQLP